MTTHDDTVLAAHLGTAHLAESLTAAIDPAYLTTQGATMTTESPAEQVARLAAETEGAKVRYYCDECDSLVDNTLDCGHNDYFTGPYYYFPQAKPAPPRSRPTLAENVLRLRVAKGWTERDLCAHLVTPGAVYTFGDISEMWDGFRAWDPDLLDALAKALDTSPAALLTPQETQA